MASIPGFVKAFIKQGYCLLFHLNLSAGSDGHCEIMQLKVHCKTPVPCLKRAKGLLTKTHPAVRQGLFVMKLTTILLLATVLQVAAKTHAQTVTYSAKSVRLEKIFTVIEKQTGHVFFYDEADLAGLPAIAVALEQAPLKTALQQVLKGQPLQYNLQGTTIFITKAPVNPVLTAVEKPALPPPPPLIDVKGRVVDEEGKPVAGASVQVKGAAGKGVSTDAEGYFELKGLDENVILLVSGVNIENLEVKVSGKATLGDVVVKVKVEEGEEVVVVNTGYQKLPAGRATGSFSVVNEELLNRRVSTDILSRIADIVPGLIFHQGRTPGLRIRGQSTIFANATPLIIIDNFPYDGDINSLNPNDVESISVLKDASAASIWGARAGNGVVVITTKKGSYNSPVKVALNSNITVGQRPSLFYQPQMSSQDYVAVERALFQTGYFMSDERNINKPALSPVVELLIQNRDGNLSNEALEAEIAGLKDFDVRQDYEKYFYRPSINQQYSVNMTAGTNKYKMTMSAGHDRQQHSLNGSGFSRSSFSINNTALLAGGKLSLTGGIYYSVNKNTNNGIASLTFNNNPMFPYARMADVDGTPLAVERNLRLSFIENAEKQGLLSWEYYPLEELNLTDKQSVLTDYRLQGELTYKLKPNIVFSAIYQHGAENTTVENLYRKESYFARDLINRYSQINALGSVVYKLPYGDIFDHGTMRARSNNLRGQFNYDKKWNGRNEIKAIAGTELRTRLYATGRNWQYGYNSSYASTSLIDYVNPYPTFINGSNATIPYADMFTELTDHNFSYYGNVVYGLHNRYLLSLTARVDKSNLFGVETNQKGTPLYSIGSSWELSKEPFYKSTLFPYVRLRATYGYNGNIDKRVSALTTARFGYIESTTQIQYSQIQNPPNPQLRWERVGIANIGVDFTARRLSVSIEYYKKHGIDLIGDFPLPPSSGITTLRGNYAETKGDGFDIRIQSQNLTGPLKWNTVYIASHAKDCVVRYDRKATALNYASGADNTSSGVQPMQGRPLYSVYSFRYKGLDEQAGNPIGYLKGEESQNYATIISGTTPEELVYHGSAKPTWFGSVQNYFEYKGFSLSVMVSYRGGYYYRKGSIRYGGNKGLTSLHGDYALRWQKTGDELFTTVPSAPAAIDYARDNLYLFGESLVEKGDHIRLKDLQLAYLISNEKLKSAGISNLRIYAYADNLGILWKASSGALDPDYAYSISPPVRTFSLGFKADF